MDAWLGSVMGGQDPPHHVFIDGNSEGPSDLLSDSCTAPAGIALFGGEDGVNEFLGRTLRAGLRRRFAEKSRRYLRLIKIC